MSHPRRLLRIDIKAGAIEVSMSGKRVAIRWIPLGSGRAESVLIHRDQIRQVADALIEADPLIFHDTGDG